MSMIQEPSKPNEPPLCRCGCGQPVTRNQHPPYDWNTWLRGHCRRGKHHTAETKAKMSEAHTGRKRSEASKRKMSESAKNRFRNPENRRKTSEATKKAMENPDVRKRISEALTGRKPSVETRMKIREATKRILASPEMRRKRAGSNCPVWKGGISYENDPPELNKELKQAIRRRDSFSCLFCGYTNKGKKRKLPTHHIDGDIKRRNNSPNNLITLCTKCHRETQTAGDKAAWIRVCTNLMKKIKRQNPEGHRAAIRIYEQNIKIYYGKG